MRLLFVFISVLSFVAMAPQGDAPAKIKKASIKTSAICGMCKVTIEKALFKLDGVKSADLDVVTKKVKVSYDANKTDVNTLRQAIAAAGYDADEVPARQKSYDKLPGCCQKGASCGPEEHPN